VTLPVQFVALPEVRGVQTEIDFGVLVRSFSRHILLQRLLRLSSERCLTAPYLSVEAETHQCQNECPDCQGSNFFCLMSDESYIASNYWVAAKPTWSGVNFASLSVCRAAH
jgi:hypothetical protein